MKALWLKLADKVTKMWRSFRIRRADAYLQRHGFKAVDENQMGCLLDAMDCAFHSIEATGADVSQFKAHAIHLYRSLRNYLQTASRASHLLRTRYFDIADGR